MIRRSNSLCLEFLIILKNKIMNDKNSAINAVALKMLRTILALFFFHSFAKGLVLYSVQRSLRVGYSMIARLIRCESYGEQKRYHRITD